MVSAMVLATLRHSAASQPSARAGMVPSERTKTKAGKVVRPNAFTAVRSGSVKTKNSLANGPRNERVSAAGAVTIKLVRAAESPNERKIRAAVARIHELSLV